MQVEIPLTKEQSIWVNKSLELVFQCTVSEELGRPGSLHPAVVNELIRGTVFTGDTSKLNEEGQQLLAEKRTALFQLELRTATHGGNNTPTGGASGEQTTQTGGDVVATSLGRLLLSEVELSPGMRGFE